MRPLTSLVVLAAVACTDAPDTDVDGDSALGTDTDIDSDVDSDSEPAMLTDVQGNTYLTVRIGDQVWMAENLRVTAFRDGTSISEWAAGERWYRVDAPEPLWQWADTSDLNDLYAEDLPEDYFGVMYNEAVLGSGQLSPPGWRLPTPDDVRTLMQTVADDGFDAAALRSTAGWTPEGANGTDVYGFNLLAGGYVASGGSATGAGASGFFATSTSDVQAFTRTVAGSVGGPELLVADNGMQLGAAVRLIRE